MNGQLMCQSTPGQVKTSVSTLTKEQFIEKVWDYTGDGGKVKNDQQVYFRYTRYDLSDYARTDSLPEGIGNSSDMEYDATWFRYQNYTLTASSQFGAGIQMPLNFLQFNAEVNIVIKSQYGFTSEIAYVVPFLYNIRYFKGQI